MEKQQMNILVVDDNPDIREVLHVLLFSEGYQVDEAISGEQALSFVEHKHYDLILLDIMMPGLSGIETCDLLRKQTTAPILFLTARSRDEDKRQAYLNGGDDYLVKPFSQQELLLKVHSLLRRYYVYQGTGQIKEAEKIVLRDIVIEVEKNQVTKGAQTIELTNKELSILMFMVQKRGVVLSIETIFENVWGEKYLSSSANTVMVHVLNLRKKLEDDPNNPQIIRTVWGRGYQIEEE